MNKKKLKVGVAVCIDSSGNEDLQLCKVYRTLADAKAVGRGCLRVIDDSGEDYLYPRFSICCFGIAATDPQAIARRHQRGRGLKY